MRSPQASGRRRSAACLFVVMALALAAGPAEARTGKEKDGGPVRHRFVACCFARGKVVIIDEDGKFERTIEGATCVQDAWLLRNGNILYLHYGGAREVDKAGKVVWEYRSERPDEIEVHSVQPLRNGGVLIGESGRGRLIEVDRRGRIVAEIKVETKNTHKHHQFRTCRKTRQGTYLVACFGDGVFKEIDRRGKVLRELYPGPEPKGNGAHGVVPLPNGHVLASTGYGESFVEFDRKGKVVWSFGKEDLPEGMKLSYTCSTQRLANGNTVVATYHGRPQFLEITPDKKVVWSYEHPDLGEVSGIVLLDEPGDPARGEVNR